jgi:hypothetical protein
MTWLAARRARVPASTTGYRDRYGLEEGKKTNAFNIDSNTNRIYSQPDRPGRLPVAKSAFYENFVWHGDEDPYVPGTDVPRLKLLHLASNATAAFDDEIDALVEVCAAGAIAVTRSPLPRSRTKRRSCAKAASR